MSHRELLIQSESFVQSVGEFEEIIEIIDMTKKSELKRNLVYQPGIHVFPRSIFDKVLILLARRCSCPNKERNTANNKSGNKSVKYTPILIVQYEAYKLYRCFSALGIIQYDTECPQNLGYQL